MDWRLLTPLLTAFSGWLLVKLLVGMLLHPLKPIKVLGFTFQGILLKQRPELSGKLARFTSEEFFSFSDIEKRLLSTQNYKRIIPEVEAHIDHFLAVKLKERMPVIGMFVGERTTSQLKEVFMEELETLFPIIMGRYIAGLKEDFNLEDMITAKLASIPDDKLQAYIRCLAYKQLRFLPVLGTLFGFIIGGIQLLVILFLYK